MVQCKYLIRILSSFPNANRVHECIVPVGPGGRREGVKGVPTRSACIAMIYGKRIHVLLGWVYVYEAPSVRAPLSDLWGLVERCQLQIFKWDRLRKVLSK